MDKRESIELCDKHNACIIAYEEETGNTLCEKCVYQDGANKPVFTASVAHQIEKHFEKEYIEFQRLIRDFREINTATITKKIQVSIGKFFDLFRHKIDELESKTVSKINQSSNLASLMDTVDTMGEYLETEKISEKYNSQRDRIKRKIDSNRYTYLCQRREEFDEVTEELKEDNVKMAIAIKKVKDLIDNIFDVKMDEARIENVQHRLARECILIDQKKPEFDLGSDETGTSYFARFCSLD